MAESDAHRRGAAAMVGAAEVQGVGAVALVDPVEHAVEGRVVVVGVEQVARGLAVLDEVAEGDADLEEGAGVGRAALPQFGQARG